MEGVQNSVSDNLSCWIQLLKRRSDMEKRDTGFNFEKALEAIQNGQPLLGKEGILNPLIKELSEAALEGEIDSHLARELSVNRRNGKSKKTIKSLNGNFDLSTPRDRTGTFSPQLVKKHQTTISGEIEGKIIALYGPGMSYKDISSHLQEMYGLEVSSGTLAAVTDKILQTIKEWQARPLESIYPIVWLDAIHYKIRENGRVRGHAVYTIPGLNLEGKKEVLGLYLSENEGSRFWLQVLTDLSNRGVSDILIACIDGLKGFPEVIESIFPKTEIQLCIVHQIRNSLKYIGSKDQKAFMADLKQVYRASNKELAGSEMDRLELSIC